MDHTAELSASCSPATLFSWVDDLGRYPSWLGIVERAEPAPADPGDPGPAWIVDLSARVGPFSRAKRLRMVRRAIDAPRSVEFARRELDGRDHGVWELRAHVAGDATSSHLRMHLHYGGRLWGPVLEPILGEEIERSRARLVRLVAADADAT
ncbi:SRPBCC family protein [Actinomarinicola tropica]|uniref:SRPBCC family protein n=1 Tax=Actinomarinicola tropica TaxID=2789776 RepID=A0A5Q2RHW3_9ACTN|nr:SRPBCC family protein [Actinomarinicola tropica]QGG95124.1 hypothetical protein GH723_08440 [Actinomarinicola tropica]